LVYFGGQKEKTGLLRGKVWSNYRGLRRKKRPPKKNRDFTDEEGEQGRKGNGCFYGGIIIGEGSSVPLEGIGEMHIGKKA